MKKCLIYVERGYEAFAGELLTAAEEMYGLDYEGVGLGIGIDTGAVSGYFDRIFFIPEGSTAPYDMKNITGAVKQLHDRYHFDCILIPATYRGRMLAPRAAMALETGLVADVTGIEKAGEHICMVRPAFSGKLMAAIENVSEGPDMMSVRPGVFLPKEDRSKQTVIEEYFPEVHKPTGIRRIRQEDKPQTRDIRRCEVLVAGGGGILKDFDCLDPLAECLGGMKAASRRVVDAGVADRSIQVGQSGKVVRPRLYIAAGIYGAIQHVAGLQKVEHLIAVNTNKEAPICSLADIVVEGDAKTFAELLVRRIDRENNSDMQ